MSKVSRKQAQKEADEFFADLGIPYMDENKDENISEGVYEFGIKKSKELGVESVVLADDTHLVIGKKQISFMFPKKKFKKIFQDQINDKSTSFIGISFNMTEINAIDKGLEMLLKNQNKGETRGKTKNKNS